MIGRISGSIFAAAVLTAASSPPASTVAHYDAATVDKALSQGGQLASSPDFKVSGSHRSGPGEVEVHLHETDVFYVTDGDATMVTGGTVVGNHETAPGQFRGTDIRGGTAQHLAKGEVFVIPAGVPHWFKEVSPTVSYFVVKVIK